MPIYYPTGPNRTNKYSDASHPEPGASKRFYLSNLSSFILQFFFCHFRIVFAIAVLLHEGARSQRRNLPTRSRVCHLIAFWHNRESGRAGGPASDFHSSHCRNCLTGKQGLGRSFPQAASTLARRRILQRVVANPLKTRRVCRAIVLNR